jgi:hypothetical protein
MRKAEVRHVFTFTFLSFTGASGSSIYAMSNDMQAIFLEFALLKIFGKRTDLQTRHLTNPSQKSCVSVCIFACMQIYTDMRHPRMYTEVIHTYG